MQNDFSTLDAQSELCALATVAPAELAPDVAPVSPVLLNASPVQLTRWQRKAFEASCKLPDTSEPATPETKSVCAAFRARVLDTFAAIHAEVEPLRDAIRRRDAELLAW